MERIKGEIDKHKNDNQKNTRMTEMVHLAIFIVVHVSVPIVVA